MARMFVDGIDVFIKLWVDGFNEMAVDLLANVGL